MQNSNSPIVNHRIQNKTQEHDSDHKFAHDSGHKFVQKQLESTRTCFFKVLFWALESISIGSSISLVLQTTIILFYVSCSLFSHAPHKPHLLVPRRSYKGTTALTILKCMQLEYELMNYSGRNEKVHHPLLRFSWG